MITVENQHNQSDRLGNKITFEFRGLSGDTKPTTTYGGANIGNGSVFLEMDTELLYFYDESTNDWVGNEGE